MNSIHFSLWFYGMFSEFSLFLLFLCPLCVCQAGTMLGPPDTVVELGETEVSDEIFMDYLSSLGESTYRSNSYLFHLFLTCNRKVLDGEHNIPQLQTLMLKWHIMLWPDAWTLFCPQRWQVSLVWAQLQHLHQWSGSVPDRQVHPLLHHWPSVWSPFHVSVILSLSAAHDLIFFHFNICPWWQPNTL